MRAMIIFRLGFVPTLAGMPTRHPSLGFVEGQRRSDDCQKQYLLDLTPEKDDICTGN